jgi:hypothetical protein
MNRTTRIVELAARLHVFLMLNIYALGKLAGGQFYRRGQLPPEVAATPLGEAGPFELAWTFMGYSYGYILFVGMGQLLGAWLLLWERTKLLGVAILLPIMANIVVFDVFFLDRLGALGSAILYSCQLLLILWLNREKVREALQHLTQAATPAHTRGEWWLHPSLALVLVGLFFLLDQMIVRLLGQ